MLVDYKLLYQMNLLMKNFIDENQENLKKWNHLAENDDFDEKKLLEVIHSIGDLIKEIDLQEESLKKLVTNLEVIHFSESAEDLIESMIGVFNIKSNFDNEKDVQEQSGNEKETNESKDSTFTADQNGIQCKTQ